MSFQNSQEYNGWDDSNVNNSCQSNSMSSHNNLGDGGGWGSSNSWGGGQESDSWRGGDSGSPNRPRGRGRGRGRGGRGRGRGRQNDFSSGFGDNKSESFGSSDGGGFGGNPSNMLVISIPKSMIGKLIGKLALNSIFL